MAGLSKITITFNDDLVDTNSINIGINELGTPTVYNWDWVNSRVSSFEVTEGTPTVNTGETSAINFASAFNLDKNTSLEYTVTQNLNIVEISAINSNNTFTFGDSLSNVTFLVGEELNITPIKVRSPYYVSADIFNGVSVIDPESVDFELRIWSGDISTDKPINANYEYKKTPRFLTDQHIYIDIGKQVQDFINTEYSQNLQCKTVFVEVNVITYYDGGQISNSYNYIAFDSYSNYKEGLKSSINEVMINNRSILQLSGSDIYLPIYKGGDDYTVEFRNNTIVLETVNVTGGTVTDTSNAVEVIQSSEYTTNNIRVQNTTQATEFIIDVEQITECIYTPVRCVFLNKQGVLQEMYFFKSNKESLDVTKKDYKANILTESIVNNVSVLSYDSNSHNKRKYNTQANKSIELNTGYIPEDNNTLIEELLLSEYVWIEVNNIVYPVDATTKSNEYLTKINDQLIKYAIKFDYSFDVVQNIR